MQTHPDSASRVPQAPQALCLWLPLRELGAGGRDQPRARLSQWCCHSPFWSTSRSSDSSLCGRKGAMGHCNWGSHYWAR